MGVPEYLLEDAVLNSARFLFQIIAFLVLCANQSFKGRRAEAKRSGGEREELGHSVKISLALPDEKVRTITKILRLLNIIVCILWPEMKHLSFSGLLYT